MVVLALCGDAPAAIQNSVVVLVIGSAYMAKWQQKEACSDLRDGILCKREILHQHIQAFVLFI